MQRAFVRLWAMRDEVRVETVEPLVWRIALNLAAKRLRWKRLRAFFGLGDDLAVPSTVESDLDRAGWDRRVRDAVLALPEAEREVVTLCSFSSLTQEEAAAALGVPPGTVASRKNRAYARLRQALGEEAADVA